MPRISIFLQTHTFSVYRLSTAGIYELVSSDRNNPQRRRGLFQPLTDIETTIANENLAQYFELYTSYDSDIKRSDKIVDQANRDFRVDGVDYHNYGQTPYKKFILALEGEVA